MLEKPIFASLADFREQLECAEFWWPHAKEVLIRHDLLVGEWEPVAGTGGTYPTIIHGEVVVKFFGYTKQWRTSFEQEKVAQMVLAQRIEIAVPTILASGILYDDAWGYLVMSKMSGLSWEHSDLTGLEKQAVAMDLGRQIGLVHALAFSKDYETSLLELDLISAAQQSSFPAHLIPQIEAYVDRVPPLDTVFVHGDLMERHVFTANGRLTGIIDWGDAAVFDRHYELAKLHLDLFDCDKQLLRLFLEASHWPVTEDFAHKALVLAIYRQAYGLTQHHTMDVFLQAATVI